MALIRAGDAVIGFKNFVAVITTVYLLPALTADKGGNGHHGCACHHASLFLSHASRRCLAISRFRATVENNSPSGAR